MKLVLYRIHKNEQLLRNGFVALVFVNKKQDHLRRFKKSISTRRIYKLKKHWFQKMLQKYYCRNRIRQMQLKSCFHIIQAFFQETREMKRRNLILKFYRIRTERVFFNRIKVNLIISKDQKILLYKTLAKLCAFKQEQLQIRQHWRLGFLLRLWIKFTKQSKQGLVHDECQLFNRAK